MTSCGRRAERGAQRRLVGRPQDDLGALGAEGVQRAGEQPSSASAISGERESVRLAS
jgi:hypothetical protein